MSHHASTSASFARMVAVAVLVAALLAAALALILNRPPAPVVSRSVPPPVMAVAPAPASALTPDPRFVVKHILSVRSPMRIGDHHWDESGAPAGQVVVTVDLAARVLSVFRAGYEIGTAVIIFGAEEKPTPLGIFPITQKDATHRSTIYGGAPMPYMLRLTNDGISIHGSDVADGYVTHGCVGIPVAFARKLFAAVKLGDKIIVTRGETLKIGDPITAA
jgi:lipoprotein-anchoring transpeptidase ErfK/SrfK